MSEISQEHITNGTQLLVQIAEAADTKLISLNKTGAAHIDVRYSGPTHPPALNLTASFVDYPSSTAERFEEIVVSLNKQLGGEAVGITTGLHGLFVLHLHPDRIKDAQQAIANLSPSRSISPEPERKSTQQHYDEQATVRTQVGSHNSHTLKIRRAAPKP
jgi:hypothetical protein